MRNKIAEQLKLLNQDGSAETFFDHVVFCTNVTYADGGFKGGVYSMCRVHDRLSNLLSKDLTAVGIAPSDLAELKTQNELKSAWRSLAPSFPEGNIHVLPSIQHAVDVVRELESASVPVKVLVAGSLHLVGGLIEVAGLSEVAL